MSKKNQYEVQRFYGVPVEADANGTYQLKLDPRGEFKVHTWRTGKHTKGKFTGVGQLMLTENNLPVVILKAEPMAFKDRHTETPLQRFLTVAVTPAVLAMAQREWEEQQ